LDFKESKEMKEMLEKLRAEIGGSILEADRYITPHLDDEAYVIVREISLAKAKLEEAGFWVEKAIDRIGEPTKESEK